MSVLTDTTTSKASRRITHRTAGRAHGPIVRLVSPGDLGQSLRAQDRI